MTDHSEITDAVAAGRYLMICGPTAAGKSGLALALAEAWGGTVINADSMQIYRDLRVLTARPDAEDEARAPHRLYGVVDGGERASVAAFWNAPNLCSGPGSKAVEMFDGREIRERNVAVCLARPRTASFFKPA